MFDKNYIKNQLSFIDDNLDGNIEIYIFGGGAMSFLDLKAATKDIDVLVSNETQAKQLIQALIKSNYRLIKSQEIAYLQMRAREIIENEDGFRWDIFVDRICGGLSFSEAMKSRAEPFMKFSHIETFLISPEDIFILKAVTSRPRDREDMFSLFSYGLDNGIIKNEIKRQAQIDQNKAWLSYFFIGLDELVDQYNIVYPDYDEFLSYAEEEMLEHVIKTLIERKPRSIKELVKRLKIDKKEIVMKLDQLKKSNIIVEKQKTFQVKKTE